MWVVYMGNRIKELRQERHMTQIRLSIELETSQETISHYESGNFYPSFPMLVKMANILNSSIDYMMGLSDVRNPRSSTLTPNAEKMLSLYTTLDDNSQEKVIAYTQGLLDK